MASYLPPSREPPPKVNNNNVPSPPGLSNSINRFNAATATALPSSSPSVASSRRSLSTSQYSSPLHGNPSPRTFQRSPSSMSMYSNGHSPTPVMHRSPSAMSRSPSSMSMHGGSPAPALRKRASMGSFHGVTPPRSRRSSPSPFNRSPLAVPEEEPAYTARSIAKKHFASELEMHSDATVQRPSNTIIILHDSCYGHRYSRPRTSKAGLASIVERPERIQASVLGVSVAYVRLGGRHDEGWHPLHPKREASSLPSIPFRIRKTGRKLPLSSPAVVNVHGTKWMDELKVMCSGAEAKLASTGKELARESSKNTDGLPGKLHEGDLYLCAESLEAMEGALGAVCEGVDAVFQGSAADGGPSRAFVIIRPPGHHCDSNYPSGFCWLNNVHVGIQHAILNHGLTHAAIIDFDLHHGDGSQSIAWDHNKRASNAAKNTAAWKKTSIGYFSLHDINSYPCEMGDEEKVKNASICVENAHGQNIWNVHLESWKTEQEFWDIYEVKYSVLLEKARKFLRTQTEIRSSSNSAPPKAAIFFSAGFDASEWESDGMQRHNVNVPTEFYARLSRDVVKLAGEEGLGVDGRVISVLEGGYSDRALMTGVLSHISGLAGGDSMVKDESAGPGLAREMGRRLSSFDGKTGANGFHLDSSPYDTEWWSQPCLERLDLVLNPLPVPEPYKPTRKTALGNFSSPTQSFIAKVVPHRKTSYGSPVTIESSPHQSAVRRTSSPIPPDVDWATAAHELSKLLIPTDRQITSCKPEELSAAATRDRRERQSTLNLSENGDGIPQPMGPPAQPTRMALRERKAPKSYVDEEDERPARPASKAGRRKTVAGAALMTAPNEPFQSAHQVPPQPELKKPTKSSSRRQSLLSNVSTSTRVPAVQLNGHPRPDTAQSIRPESSMSMRAPSAAGRKAKVPVQVRPEAKSSKAKKAPSPNHGSIPNSDGPPEVPPIPSAYSVQSDGAKSKTDDSAIDNITSGLGKIKLTLLTKAQREAKEQAKEQAKEAAKVVRKPTVPKATKTSVKPKSAVAPTSLPAPVVNNEVPPLAPAITLPPAMPVQQPTKLIEALHTPLPPSSPPERTSTPQIPSEPTGNGDVFVPYQPDGPAPGPVAQPDNLTWLAPNTNTPAAIKSVKRHELPVFSSTGPIPFAGASEPSGQNPLKQNGNSLTQREIPETPE